MLKAVIFDMDGVLVDSERYWFESRIQFAAALGKTWTMDDQRLAMGRNTDEWARVMQERLHLHDMPADDIVERVRGNVIARLHDQLPLLPGAEAAVHTAAAFGRVALASGSPTLVIDTVMNLTGLNKVFETIVYGDTVAQGKPAPDIYLEAARRLGVDPTECVGIEDSINGIHALNHAGIRIIAVPSPGFTLPEAVVNLADVLLPNLTAFTVDMLNSLNSGETN